MTEFAPFLKAKECIDTQSYLWSLIVLFIDFFHFTIVTSSTVGYGDMHPTTPIAKLFTDVQIMFSFAILVIGITKYSKHGVNNSDSKSSS